MTWKRSLFHLFVQKDCDHALKELAKICILADCTMVAAFTYVCHTGLCVSGVLCVLCLSVATLSRQPAVSSLKITERSFRCASPCLRNQLPDSFHPHRQSYLDSPSRLLVEPSFSPSPLSAFITPSLFHPRLKIYLLSESFPPQ